jgi:hypothetical protein
MMKPGLPYGSTNYQWFCDKYDDFIYLDRVAFTESLRSESEHAMSTLPGLTINRIRSINKYAQIRGLVAA